jgi:hypothetical protein
MVDYSPWAKASQQHLAHLRQEASVTPVVLVHQHRVDLAADLGAHRRQQLRQYQAGEQHQSQQHQQWDMAASLHQSNHNNLNYKEIL